MFDCALAVYRIYLQLTILSFNTANGPYFEEAIKVMARTCVEAESSRNYNQLVRVPFITKLFEDDPVSNHFPFHNNMITSNHTVSIGPKQYCEGAW